MKNKSVDVYKYLAKDIKEEFRFKVEDTYSGIFSPLTHFATIRSLDFIKCLVNEVGLNPRIYGEEALIGAAAMGFIDIVRFLAEIVKNGEALIVAARLDRSHVVEYLVSTGPKKFLVDPNVQKGQALIEAVENNRAIIVSYLLALGAKENSQHGKALIK